MEMQTDRQSRDTDSKVVLEERIEEVTTSTFSDLEEFDTNDNNDALECVPSGKKSIRVAFPELGVDLVDASVYCFDADSFSEDKSVRITDLLSWEDNWLFQKKRKSNLDVVAQYCFSALEAAISPNRMLIPNPSQLLQAKVGNKEIDQLSDLSECNSGSSVNFSEDDEKSESDFAVDDYQQCIEMYLKSDNDLQMERKLSESQVSEKEIVEVKAKAEKINEIATNEAICVEVVPKNVPIPQFVPSQQRLTEAVEDPCFVFLPGSASVQCGILIQFCCRVKGSHPIGVSWFRGDHRLLSDDFYRIIDSGNDHILEIKCTNAQLGGSYSCVVFNHLNQKWTDFTLEVKSQQRIRKEKLAPSTYLQKREKKVLPKESSPTVIQRTWDQRRAEENSERRQAEFESVESEPPPLPDDTVGTSRTPTTSIAEREHRKWEECSVKWPNNPYTKESIEKRKLLRAASLDSMLDECSLSDDSEQMPRTSRSKDLSRFKRDYFVPVLEKDEALNCFEEKVYSSAKYFSLNNISTPQSDVCVCNDRLSESFMAEQEAILSSVSVKDLVNRFSENSGKKSTPKLRRRSTFSISNNSKATTNGVSANLTHINTNYKVPFKLCTWYTRGSPSVLCCCSSNSRKFVVSPTIVSSVSPLSLFSNADDSQNDQTENVHSLTARNLTKFRDQNKDATQTPAISIQRSKSLMDIDKSQQSSSNSSDVCSATNEGYNSDESNSSAALRKTAQMTTVKLKTPKKISRSILQRASYWQKRCEQGLLSDSSVNEDFPAMEDNSYLK